MTSKAATDAIRAAVFELLDGAISVPSPYAAGNPDRVVPVVEEVGNTVAPYVEVGASVELPDDQHDVPGALVMLTLHTWSKYRGFAEIGGIHTRLKELLDKEQIVVPGWDNVYARVQNQQAMRDEDPQYRHGVTDVQFRLTQQEG